MTNSDKTNHSAKLPMIYDFNWEDADCIIQPFAPQLTTLDIHHPTEKREKLLDGVQR